MCDDMILVGLNLDFLGGKGAKIDKPEEEFLLAEMARLHTLLALYEGKEEFMKAAIIKRRLEIIQKKLDNL